MTAATLRMDLDLTRARTRWTMSLSFILHMLLFLWVVLHRASAPDIAPITEITLIEPGDLAAGEAAPTPPSAARETVSGLAARASADAHFQRAMPRSEIAPDPQDSWVFADRLDARLAAMQQDATHASAGIASSKVPTSLFG